MWYQDTDGRSMIILISIYQWKQRNIYRIKLEEKWAYAKDNYRILPSGCNLGDK